MSRITLLLALCAGSACQLQVSEFDLVILNGEVVEPGKILRGKRER